MSRLRVVSLLVVVLAALVVFSSAASPSYSSGDFASQHNVSIAAPGIPAHFDTAQQFGAVCEDQVQAALEQVTTACESVGRNEACYGNSMIDTRFREDVQPVSFRRSGDIASLTLLDRIQTQPYSALMGTWGIALLKAQVNLPDALPGQNVTFLLFGDTTVDNPTPDMRAVTIRTRLGGVACEELPDSALIIQAPQGERVTMTINGARVTLGSTAHITAVMNDEMIISTLEGEVVVEAFMVERVVPPGAEVWMPLGGGDGLSVEDEPADIRPYDGDLLEILPVGLLERDVEIIAPIDAALLEATDEAQATDDGEDDECAIPDGWTTYIVKAGDSLETLSALLGITRRELRLSTCIQRSNAQLIEGQTLFVPFEIIEPTPILDGTAQVDADDSSGGVTVFLAADPGRITPGNCSWISWDVRNGTLNYSLFLDGDDVTNEGARLVCPEETTTYAIEAYFGDGQVASAEVTIQVVIPLIQPPSTVQNPTLSLPTQTLFNEPAPTQPPPSAPSPIQRPLLPSVPTLPLPTLPLPTQPLPTLPLPTQPLPTQPPPTQPPPTQPPPTQPPTRTPGEDCDDSGIGLQDDCECDDNSGVGLQDDCECDDSGIGLLDDCDDSVNGLRQQQITPTLMPPYGRR